MAISTSPDHNNIGSELTPGKKESIIAFTVSRKNTNMYIYTNPSYCQPPVRSTGLRLVRHQLDVVFKLKSSLRVILARHKVHDQRVLDGKY